MLYNTNILVYYVGLNGMLFMCMKNVTLCDQTVQLSIGNFLQKSEQQLLIVRNYRLFIYLKY